MTVHVQGWLGTVLTRSCQQQQLTGAQGEVTVPTAT